MDLDPHIKPVGCVVPLIMVGAVLVLAFILQMWLFKIYKHGA